VGDELETKDKIVEKKPRGGAGRTSLERGKDVLKGGSPSREWGAGERRRLQKKYACGGPPNIILAGAG